MPLSTKMHLLARTQEIIHKTCFIKIKGRSALWGFCSSPLITTRRSNGFFFILKTHAYQPTTKNNRKYLVCLRSIIDPSSSTIIPITLS